MPKKTSLHEERGPDGNYAFDPDIAEFADRLGSPTSYPTKHRLVAVGLQRQRNAGKEVIFSDDGCTAIVRKPKRR